MFKSAATKIAHNSTIPSFGGNKDLRPLQDLITAEKSVLVSLQKLSIDFAKASEALRIWGEGEGEDLRDTLSSSMTTIHLFSAALSQYALHGHAIRDHMKSVRTLEEGLDALKRRRKSLASKADAAERKLSKTSPEHKSHPAQVVALNELRDQIRSMDTQVMRDEASLGDFKRQSAKEWMVLKFGGLSECCEKGVAIGEAGKQIISEIPQEPTQPGLPRAFYSGHARTLASVERAQRAVSAVVFSDLPSDSFRPSPSSTSLPLASSPPPTLPTRTYLQEQGQGSPQSVGHSPYPGLPEVSDYLSLQPNIGASGVSEHFPLTDPSDSSDINNGPWASTPYQPPTDEFGMSGAPNSQNVSGSGGASRFATFATFPVKSANGPRPPPLGRSGSTGKKWTSDGVPTLSSQNTGDLEQGPSFSSSVVEALGSSFDPESLVRPNSLFLGPVPVYKKPSPVNPPSKLSDSHQGQQTIYAPPPGPPPGVAPESTHLEAGSHVGPSNASNSHHNGSNAGPSINVSAAPQRNEAGEEEESQLAYMSPSEEARRISRHVTFGEVIRSPDSPEFGDMDGGDLPSPPPAYCAKAAQGQERRYRVPVPTYIPSPVPPTLSLDAPSPSPSPTEHAPSVTTTAPPPTVNLQSISADDRDEAALNAAAAREVSRELDALNFSPTPRDRTPSPAMTNSRPVMRVNVSDNLPDTSTIVDSPSTNASPTLQSPLAPPTLNPSPRFVSVSPEIPYSRTRTSSMARSTSSLGVAPVSSGPRTISAATFRRRQQQVRTVSGSELPSGRNADTSPPSPKIRTLPSTPYPPPPSRESTQDEPVARGRANSRAVSARVVNEDPKTSEGEDDHFDYISAYVNSGEEDRHTHARTSEHAGYGRGNFSTSLDGGQR